MKFRGIVGAICLVLGLLGIASARDLRVTGSDLLGAAFERALGDHAHQTGEQVTWQLDGSRPAIARLKAGEAEVGLVTLPPGELLPGDPFISRVVGYQAIAVVVPEASPLRQITLAQLRAVFGAGSTETIARWGELGVSGEARQRTIALHALAPSGGLTLPLFRRLLLNDGPVKPHLQTASSVEALHAAVRGSAWAIALSPAVPALGAPLRAIAVATNASAAAYAPTAENLHQGFYALRLPLYVMVRREDVPELLPFLRFLLSEECAEALAHAHYVPLPVSARNQLVFELEELR